MLPERPHFCGGFGLNAVSVVPEEVLVQYLGDAQEQFGVDGRAPEELIDVGAVAAEFAGKPADGALLTAEFFFYEATYVQTFWHVGHRFFFLSCCTPAGHLLKKCGMHVIKKARVLYHAARPAV